MRPPRKASALVALLRAALRSALVFCDDMADAGLGENLPRLANLAALDQDAPGKNADRSLEQAHVGVGDDETDRVLLQERADIGQKHRVVRAQQFLHCQCEPLPIHPVSRNALTLNDPPPTISARSIPLKRVRRVSLGSCR